MKADPSKNGVGPLESIGSAMRYREILVTWKTLGFCAEPLLQGEACFE